MKQFLLQLSILLVCFGIIQANEKWEVDSEGQVPKIQMMKYVDEEKQVLVGTGMQGMLIFSTDGGKEIGAYQYTTHDWVSIVANEEVIVFGGRDFSLQSTNLLAYTYDKGKTVHVVDVEKTRMIFNISLRDYPTVYYITNENKVFKSDSNFTDWQEYAEIDFLVYESQYDAIGNLWLTNSDGNLFKSTDNGKTYEKVDYEYKDYKIRLIYEKNGYIIMDIVGEDFAIYTPDNGETWKKIANSKDKVLLDLCIVNENLMYMSYFKGADGSEVYRSFDGGETFEAIDGLEVTDSTFLFFCFKDETYGFAYGSKDFMGYLVRYTFDTGVEEYITADEEIKITPNPSSDILHYNFDGLAEAIEIVDINGKVHQIKEHGQQIDISNLAPGTYFLKIKSQAKAYIKQFVVAR